MPPPPVYLKSALCLCCTFSVSWLKVVQLVKENTHWVQGVVTSCLCLVFDSSTPVAPLVVSPYRSRKREDYEPATEQEVLEWLADRQEDMNTALMAGNPSEAARISGMITDATRSLQPAVQPSMVTNMVR